MVIQKLGDNASNSTDDADDQLFHRPSWSRNARENSYHLIYAMAYGFGETDPNLHFHNQPSASLCQLNNAPTPFRKESQPSETAWNSTWWHNTFDLRSSPAPGNFSLNIYTHLV
ncbi:hypothetical protein VTL71DRAFT_15623, partial [Oculimacula yallundae]